MPEQISNEIKELGTFCWQGLSVFPDKRTRPAPQYQWNQALGMSVKTDKPGRPEHVLAHSYFAHSACVNSNF